MADKKIIVVIDDEKDFAALIKDVLEQAGDCDVRLAHDGDSGRDLVFALHPDLVLCDLVMPRVRGDHLIKEIRDHPRVKNTPVILMSGVGELMVGQARSAEGDKPEDHNEKVIVSDYNIDDITRAFGVQGFLMKPFDFKTLVDSIQQALHDKQGRTDATKENSDC